MKQRLIRAAAAALLALSSVVVGGAPSSALGPQTAATEEPVPGLTVQLSNVVVSPEAPRPHELLHIQGVARAAAIVEGKEITLRVSRLPIRTREDLHAAVTDNERLFETAIVKKAPVGLVFPGSDTPWAIDVPVDDLHLTFGVYRLSVEFMDTAFYPRARVNTFLPYFPAGTWKPTNLAWVWPIVDAPRRASLAQPQPQAQSLLKSPDAPSAAPTPSASSSSDGAAPTNGDIFLDDTLAASLAKEGRLGQLVAGAAAAAQQSGTVPPSLPVAVPAVPGSGAPTSARKPVLPVKPMVVEKLVRRPVPVTWAIDPDVLESARSMESGYLVRDKSGTRRGSSEGVQAATTWLAGVTATVGSSLVIPLPYADADVVALARAGRSDEVSHVLRPSSDADSIFRAVFGRPVSPSITWPVGGLLTQDALDMLAASQVSTVVLAAGALPVRNPYEFTATPSMQAPALPAGGGTVAPLVSDATLDGLIAADPALDAVGLAKQRFLAETALITAEAPSFARDILLLPPRHATNVRYLSDLLALTGRVPWLNGITVDDALTHQVDNTERASLTYPDSARAAEVSRAVINSSYTTRGKLAMLTSILTSPEVLTPMERGLLRTYSASWRQDARTAESVRADADRQIVDWIKKVSVLTSRDPLTLLSKSSKIPLTVTNGLDQEVRGLRVQLRAVNSANMQDVEVRNVKIFAHDRNPLFLDANIPVVGSVRFAVVVSILTSDGQTLTTANLQVHSTGSGGLVLGVTLALMGLLFFVVAVRLLRRIWTYYRARGALA